MSILVIVESPSKCKTIESYLGSDYRVIASCGHFRGLTHLDQIDFVSMKIKFETTKPKIVKFLREEVAISKEVILATDDDREGEAIAWHICQICKLSVETTKRIIFHEITKPAILNALNEPRTILMNRVYSQNTRQILDLYIGFKISPILWKYVQHKLSAGRCQTPALHMIAEQEEKIKSQSYDTHFNVSGYFTGKDIEFKLNHSFSNVKDFHSFLQLISNKKFEIKKEANKEVSIPPPLIFTTSTLQQQASNQLGMSPQQTMRSAQILYEQGLITYMRTDQATYSEDFIKKMSGHLGNDFNSPRVKMDRDKIVANAHEGIRITQFNIENTSIDSSTDRLYQFIYKHTLQTCMKPCINIHKTYSIDCGDDFIFTHTSIITTYEGWKKGMKFETTNWSNYLDLLTSVECSKIVAYEKCMNPTFHFTEAQLIRHLEESNIGRPSTYTHILESIKERNYVNLGKIHGIKVPLKRIQYDYKSHKTDIVEDTKEFDETHKLSITPLGKEVNDFCCRNFNDIFNYDYTTFMEEQLDLIENGKIKWKDSIKDFVSTVDRLLIIEGETKKSYRSLHAGLYKGNAIVIKDGPHGYYMEYKNESISLQQASFYDQITNWIDEQIVSDEITKDIIKYYNGRQSNVVLEINENWSVRNGPHGRYLFYKTKKMSKPKFYSLQIQSEDKDEIISYIIKKYKFI
jgi:DNA topoisomerase-1